MTPPTMAGWNLAIRFGLELLALAGLTLAAWSLSSGLARWFAVILVPGAAVVVWGTFNVPDDPSRSGEAPIEVRGWVRLVIELFVLVGGVAGLAIAGLPVLAMGVSIVTAAHYAASWRRVEWLIRS